jgi:membrane protease YdiL (CAAX protease family)
MVVKEKLIGIDRNWITDMFIGLFAGAGFILLLLIFPSFGAIGIPDVQTISLGLVGEAIIICLFAGLFEEVLFRGVLQDFFAEKLKFGFWISALICSGLFALFHIYAYGSVLSAISGSLFSAFLVGMLLSILAKKTNSLATTIVTHCAINSFIYFVLIKHLITIG